MPRLDSFRHTQLYVEIPPYPHKNCHNASRPKSTLPDARTDNTSHFKLVPFVEIPPYRHSKKSAQDASMNLQASKKLPTSGSRGLPLKDKNTADMTSSSPSESSQTSQKRKLETKDEPAGRKKQRVKETENEGPNPTIRTSLRAGVTASDPLKALKGRPRKVVVPPSPHWTTISNAGTKESIENRMLLREFFHRFTSLLKFSKVHRDSLDEFAHLSDQAAKAMVASLLDLLLADAKEDDQETLRSAKSELRKAGLTPTQLWSILETLRTSLPDLKIAKPELVQACSSDRRGSGVHLTSSTQLVPCIISLISVALEGPSIHDDIAEGVEACRKARSSSDEAIKAEKQRWADVKAECNMQRDEGLAKEEEAKAQLKEPQIIKDADKFDIKGWRSKYKAAETAHKVKVSALRLSLMRETSCDQLRFAPAGTDVDGRTYYILSVSPKGVRSPNGEARKKMDRWAWMVSVHDPSLGNDEEAWYGFHDAQDIRVLAKWLAWRGAEEARAATKGVVGCSSAAESLPGLSTSDSINSHVTATDATIVPVQPTVPVTSNTKGPAAPPGITKLCKSLDEFADFLDWVSPKKGD